MAGRRAPASGTRQRWRLAGLGLLVGALAASAFVWAGGFASDGDPASVRLPTGAFIPSEQTDRAIVWAVGDGADGGDAAKALAGRIAAGHVDLLLYLGDVYEDGTPSDFAENYVPVYGRFASITAPTPGNHDWPNRRSGYDPYWRSVTRKDPPAFYAFTIAGWQVLSLNSEAPHGSGSAQLRWLRARLERPGTCRLAFWHRPRYSAGTRHGDQDDVEPFWKALRGHARLVINGHEHDMQRLTRDGIVEFVSGAGGKSHYEIDTAYPAVAFSNDTDWGALRLELRPGVARFAFVTADGRTLDSGTISCRR